MAFSIRMTEEEEILARRYAEFYNMPLGEAFKKALFEKIEDEFDISIADTRYEEYLKDPKSRSLKELMRDEGL